MKIINRLDWLKILANTGFTFFVTLASICTFSYLVKSELPLSFIITVTIVVALIQGGVAFFKSLIDVINEHENFKEDKELKTVPKIEKRKKKFHRTQAILNNLVLW